MQRHIYGKPVAWSPLHKLPLLCCRIGSSSPPVALGKCLAKWLHLFGGGGSHINGAAIKNLSMCVTPRAVCLSITDVIAQRGRGVHAQCFLLISGSQI